jgi:23S rRNA (adenine2030-N6)-methyltransferase
MVFSHQSIYRTGKPLLSYRHSDHAGNFGDVLKHIILIEIFEYLSQSAAGFEYIDSHAGAGLYHLKTKSTENKPGYRKAVTKLRREEWPELSGYLASIHSLNTDTSLQIYPGSPVIAKQLLRSQDKAWLFELNTEQYALLKKNVGDDKRIRVSLQDGYKGLLEQLPISSGRGLVLIDPPYEVATDYDLVVETITLAHEKFTDGIYAIWYPVVDRRRILRLQERLTDIGINNMQRFELGMSADTDDMSMTASGMIVINPPATLIARMKQLLPRLVETLATSDAAFCHCDELEKV